ncbi:MAG: aryl-sulfate sulfotransferase, partial [Chloroflexota bacterium]
DPDPWFSHQHNEYLIDPTTVVLFDNSNQRCQIAQIVGCHSRGQVYKIDDQHDSASLLLNVNLESFWQALGSAQKLANGDFFFAGGYAPPSRAIEFRPDGTKVFELDTGLAEYRAYRVGVLSS